MYPKLSILLFSIFILLGCKESQAHRTGNKDQVVRIVAEPAVPANMDTDFNTFLKQFSKDSLFQISRISYPLKYLSYDFMNDSDVVKTISKQEFRKLDFTGTKSMGDTGNWEQHIVVTGNEATIEIRGIDNGIMVDFNFEKKKGKWQLAEWLDRST